MATTVSPIKILTDLGLTPWEIENDEDYLRALREGIITIEAATKGKGDKRSVILREELIRVRKGPKKTQAKEKKTTIKAKNFLPGTTFHPEDIKPVDIDSESKQDDSFALVPKRLDGIANSVESIATLLRRQLGLQKKQQRDARIKQDKINKQDREDDLEKKPDDKKTGGLPKAITKPALGFFERIKNFFLNIVIGAGVVKLFDWLKDPANAEKVEKFSNFLINNAAWILGGLATLALLPTILTVVSVVKGILSGLALLGPLLPALPWILGGILVGAVAWWIGKKISKGITGGKVIGAERKENLERLRAAGIQDATKKSLTLLDPETGEGRLKVNMYGENSITGREWKPGDPGGKNARPNLDLMVPEHAAYYVRTYGQAALDEKLAAHKSFRETKSALIDTKKDKQKSITEARKKWFIESGKEAQELGFNDDGGDIMTDGALRKMTRSKREKEWKRKKDEEWKQIKLSIEKEADEKAIKIGDKSESAVIDKNITSDGQTSATIDDSLKKETIVPGPSNKNRGGQTVVMPGGGGQQQSGGGGGGSSSSSGTPNFSSVDVQNKQTIATQMQYNKVTVDV